MSCLSTSSSSDDPDAEFEFAFPFAAAASNAVAAFFAAAETRGRLGAFFSIEREAAAEEEEGFGVEDALSATTEVTTPFPPAAAASASAAAFALASAAADGFLDPLVRVPERDLPLELTALLRRGLAAEARAAGRGGRVTAVACVVACDIIRGAGADSTLMASLLFPLLMFPPSIPPPPPPKICRAAAEKGDEQSRWFCLVLGFFGVFLLREMEGVSRRKGHRRRRSACSACDASPPPPKQRAEFSNASSFDPPPTAFRVIETDLETPFELSGGAIVQGGDEEVGGGKIIAIFAVICQGRCFLI